MNNLGDLYNAIAAHSVDIANKVCSRLVEHNVSVGNQIYAAVLGRRTQYDYDLTNSVWDVKKCLFELRGLNQQEFLLETNYPIALMSNDHLHPWGTKNDNTRSARFVHACESKFPGRRLNYLDLGCSGGGLVADFALAGHCSVGLEGSDYSFRFKRAEWGTLDKRLFTCDITKPFCLRVEKDGSDAKFDFISMWEVMEHIAENDLDQLFDNLRKHMHPASFFVGSIALVDDVYEGISLHPTVKPRQWWHEVFNRQGFDFFEYEHFDFMDHCRGTGNGPMDPNFRVTPEIGFHFTARLKS